MKIQKMGERNKLMENIKLEAGVKLNAKLTADKEMYKALLKKLVMQARENANADG